MEVGSAWVREITNPIQVHEIYVARITGPEMIAAFFGKVRNREVPADQAISASDRFKTDFNSQYRVVEVTSGVATRAMTLAQQYGLKGYDSVQLAAALEVQVRYNRLGINPPNFVSGDYRLCAAAQLERLEIENPDSHP